MRFPQKIAIALEDRLRPFLVAACTYPMRRLGACSIFFQRISKNPRLYGLQCVALFLTFPFFHASHFFFKIGYLLNHRALERLSVQSETLINRNGV